MDSHYIAPRVEDSHQSRSQSSDNQLSSTESQLQDLDIKPTISTSGQKGTSTEGPTTSTPLFLDPKSHPDSTFTTSPTTEHFTPFPQFSQGGIDTHWSCLPTTEDRPGPTPLLRLDPAEQTSSHQPLHPQPSISRSNSYPANMSAIGIQNYDSRFDAGVRQTYTWPHFDLSDQFFPQQMSPPMVMGALPSYEDTKLMPMYARSVSSSPPRGSLTPEQRELKRQRDHARRDAKERMRRDRSTSNPYTVSPKASPEMLSRSLSDYSNTLAPSPLLSQGSQQGSPNLSNISNISSPAYLAPYTPQLSDTGSDMYGPVFTMGANDLTGIPAYSMSMPYNTGAMDPAMQVFGSRPHSLSASSMDQPNVQMMQNIYPAQTPSKVGSSDSGDQVRVVHSRPKPQCWEHGCNGRQFSTFSNLLRHQREKSGAATKSICPNCGAEFTRTTARNGHMAHEKCKQRRTAATATTTTTTSS
ncbi:hypothetical protein M430DRAFT_93512 [Amorphotheca resinae ATCC 22711]|uniref:C2H2-type domain-containing protein n=1 Tax=Amorphotheca resinae ATCC 22711 TaxID=857342 RepID=A0A2T3BEM6_AMORE|nr:hypothetical protein M430DRAFT_93512 [Amorphotheca resinae ATCC 22711]PSS27877.1 hypothetical protein M430DRAFT_93512 [Amorphotheca resinae ATCC 22711]